MKRLKKRKTRFILLLFLPIMLKIIFFLTIICLIVFISLIYKNGLLDMAKSLEYINLLTTVLALAVSLLIFRYCFKIMPYFLLRRVKLCPTIWFMITGFAINLFIHLLLTFLPASNIVLSTKQHQANMFYIIIVGIILPVLEEYLFRGFIQKQLCEFTDFRYACLIQSILFGFSHFNIIQFCYTVPLGIAFAVINRKYESLFPSVIIHIMFNITNVILRVPIITTFVYCNKNILFTVVTFYILLFALRNVNNRK